MMNSNVAAKEYLIGLQMFLALYTPDLRHTGAEMSDLVINMARLIPYLGILRLIFFLRLIFSTSPSENLLKIILKNSKICPVRLQSVPISGKI